MSNPRYLERLWPAEEREGDLEIIQPGGGPAPGQVKLLAAEIKVSPGGVTRLFSWAGGIIGVVVSKADTLPPYYETYLIEEAQNGA